MLKVVKVAVEPLTPEGFAPFGEIITSFEKARPVIVKGGLRRKEIPASSSVRRQAHFAFHTDAGQAFFPSRGNPSVFMVAPVSDTILPGDIRAFRSDGSFGVCLGVRVWHTVPIALEGEEVFQSVRGDQDYAAHSVEIDFDLEQGILFEPDC